MHKAKIWIAPTLLLLLLIACGWKTWQQATAYEHQTLQIIEQLQAENRLESSGRQLLEALSFGLYDGYSRQLESLNQAQELQAAYRRSVDQLTGIFLLLSALLLLACWLARRRVDDLGYAMLSVAVVSLAVGLTTPILSIEASKSLPVLGMTVLEFQSKGILTTIEALWQGGHLWIAILLGLFSILLPLLKTGVAWLTLFSATHRFSLRGLHLSHHIGKWSMADVFVVAILVAFFSTDSGDGLTHAEVQAGLWFFATYVLLSLFGSQLIMHRLRQLETARQA